MAGRWMLMYFGWWLVGLTSYTVFFHAKLRIDLGVFIFSIGIGNHLPRLQTLFLNCPIQAGTGHASKHTWYVVLATVPSTLRNSQIIQVDSYALHAASAIAGVVSFRAFAGFSFPLFADRMYRILGYGESKLQIPYTSPSPNKIS